MLAATFLGHQGWLLSTKTTHVLVDPILGQRFGHGGLAGTVFPPRTIDLGGLPPLHAVFITHEHDDHFDIESLCRIDRAVPVYISSRSSTAMRSFIAGLGFRVELLHPDETMRIGDLRYRTFVADHRQIPQADEWDALPYLVTDAEGQGAFASSIDVPMPPAMVDALRQTPGWPGVLCLANNTTDTRFVQRGVGRVDPSDDTEALSRVLGRRLQAASEVAGTPRHVAITGGGWSHPDDVAWIDEVAFCIDPERLAASLQRQAGAPVSAVRAGEVLCMDEAGVSVARSEFVELGAEAVRPTPAPVDVPPTFEPACGRRVLERSDLPRLEAGLRQFAAFSYARPIFVAAQSMAISSSMAFSLLDDETPMVFAYAPEATAFRRVEDADPFSTFCSGFECWATDLVALFEGRIGPSALCFTGRVRCWNRQPDRLRVSPHELWRFAHPLHRPEAALRLYETVAQGRPS